MQGQRGTVGSVPESFNFDHGSSSSDTAIDPQICWNNVRNPVETRLADYLLPGDTGLTYVTPVGLERQNLTGWGMGEASSSNTQQEVSHDAGKAECGWSSSVDARAATGTVYGPGPRLEERRYEPTNILSLDNVNGNQVFMQSANSDIMSQGLNLNATIVGQGGDHCQVRGRHNLYKSTGPESEQIASGVGSDPLFLHPGRGGFLVEENDGRAGSSLEGRRLSCKRKAVEGNVGQSSVSGSYFQRAESSAWPPVPTRNNIGSSLSISAPSDQLNPRLGLGVRGISSDRATMGNAEGSQRNFRVRINPSNQQDSISSNSFSTANAVRHPSGSSQQPSRLLPVNQSLDFRSATVMDNANPPSQSVAVHVPALPQNEQPFRWNGSSSSRAAGSSNSAIPGDTLSREEAWPRNMPRHILEHPMFIPAPEMRSLVRNPSNNNLSGGNTNVTGNTSSSSGVHPSPAPAWVPDQNPPSRYPRRLSEYVRRSLFSSISAEPGGQSSNHSSLRSAPPASLQDMALPSGAGNAGHHHPYPRLASWAERQGDGVLGFPQSLRTLAAASEGRRRLASEIRNVLDLMRRGEGLRFEDVMILDQSVFFGVADIHDRHRDMRLDVDNMSYEELLALEERIGNVCTGLNEETISSRLKQRKYSSMVQMEEAEPCCVCQEEYNDGEDVGTLECGHDFHTNCIKQWLKQKNICPICKTTGLST